MVKKVMMITGNIRKWKWGKERDYCRCGNEKWKVSKKCGECHFKKKGRGSVGRAFSAEKKKNGNK